MSEKEEKIIKSVAAALPNMSERQKGYFLGYAEAIAEGQEKEEKQEEQEEAGEWKTARSCSPAWPGKFIP